MSDNNSTDDPQNEAVSDEGFVVVAEQPTGDIPPQQIIPLAPPSSAIVLGAQGGISLQEQQAVEVPIDLPGEPSLNKDGGPVAGSNSIDAKARDTYSPAETALGQNLIQSITDYQLRVPDEYTGWKGRISAAINMIEGGRYRVTVKEGHKVTRTFHDDVFWGFCDARFNYKYKYDPAKDANWNQSVLKFEYTGLSSPEASKWAFPSRVVTCVRNVTDGVLKYTPFYLQFDPSHNSGESFLENRPLMMAMRMKTGDLTFLGNQAVLGYAATQAKHLNGCVYNCIALSLRILLYNFSTECLVDGGNPDMFSVNPINRAEVITTAGYFPLAARRNKKETGYLYDDLKIEAFYINASDFAKLIADDKSVLPASWKDASFDDDMIAVPVNRDSIATPAMLSSYILGMLRYPICMYQFSGAAYDVNGKLKNQKTSGDAPTYEDMNTSWIPTASMIEVDGYLPLKERPFKVLLVSDVFSKTIGYENVMIQLADDNAHRYTRKEIPMSYSVGGARTATDITAILKAIQITDLIARASFMDKMFPRVLGLKYLHLSNDEWTILNTMLISLLPHCYQPVFISPKWQDMTNHVIKEWGTWPDKYYSHLTKSDKEDPYFTGVPYSLVNLYHPENLPFGLLGIPFTTETESAIGSNMPKKMVSDTSPMFNIPMTVSLPLVLMKLGIYSEPEIPSPFHEAPDAKSHFLALRRAAQLFKIHVSKFLSDTCMPWSFVNLISTDRWYNDELAKTEMKMRWPRFSQKGRLSTINAIRSIIKSIDIDVQSPHVLKFYKHTTRYADWCDLADLIVTIVPVAFWGAEAELPGAKELVDLAWYFSDCERQNFKSRETGVITRFFKSIANAEPEPNRQFANTLQGYALKNTSERGIFYLFDKEFPTEVSILPMAYSRPSIATWVGYSIANESSTGGYAPSSYEYFPMINFDTLPPFNATKTRNLNVMLTKRDYGFMSGITAWRLFTVGESKDKQITPPDLTVDSAAARRLQSM